MNVDGDPGKRRLCEERILNLHARSPQEALTMAKRRGKADRHSYKNSDGNIVTIEFVGVIDLMSLGIEADKDEVWYDIRERLLPMERKEKILPTEGELLDRLAR